MKKKHRFLLDPQVSLFLHLLYVTSEPFAGPLSVNFTDVQKVRQWFLAICILNFDPKTSIEV